MLVGLLIVLAVAFTVRRWLDRPPGARLRWLGMVKLVAVALIPMLGPVRSIHANRLGATGAVGRGQ